MDAEDVVAGKFIDSMAVRVRVTSTLDITLTLSNPNPSPTPSQASSSIRWRCRATLMTAAFQRDPPAAPPTTPKGCTRSRSG
eukprot:scaffold74096_cov46-Phaeocystis_antarctica.AAC.2